jgi:DMSO/TMAO reductase YedYZ heme-binding membrane subunit
LLGKRWYRLHRLVYLAAALVLLHMVVVGSHFFRWNLLTLIATVMLSILLLLELLRSLRYRKKKHE